MKMIFRHFNIQEIGHLLADEALSERDLPGSAVEITLSTLVAKKQLVGIRLEIQTEDQPLENHE